MASSTKFAANFTDGSCLSVAKVAPKIRSFLVTHSSCFPSCSFTTDEGVITILGVYQATGRGGVGKNSKEAWARHFRLVFVLIEKKCQFSQRYSVEQTKAAYHCNSKPLLFFYISPSGWQPKDHLWVRIPFPPIRSSPSLEILSIPREENKRGKISHSPASLLPKCHFPAQVPFLLALFLLLFPTSSDPNPIFPVKN